MVHPQKFDPRQVMIRPDFELQFKRDAYLQDVQLHHHDFYEVYFLLSGDVTYTIESRLYRVMPGEVLLISPRELHQVCIRPEMSAYERYTLWVAPQLLRQFSSERTDLSRCFDPSRPNYDNLLKLTPEEQRLVRTLFETLWQEYSGPAAGCSKPYVSANCQSAGNILLKPNCNRSGGVYQSTLWSPPLP